MIIGFGLPKKNWIGGWVGRTPNVIWIVSIFLTLQKAKRASRTPCMHKLVLTTH